jgi:hypothetical protein
MDVRETQRRESPQAQVCDGHWRVHKPSTCEGRAHKFSGDKHQNDAIKDKTSNEKLKLANAITAVQDGSDNKHDKSE